MISNPEVIRSNVLKNTINEQIIKVTKVLACAPVVCERINRLNEQLPIQQNILEQLRQKHLLRQDHLSRVKQSLKRELKTKMFLKITQQQALSAQMKILQQNCHFIRQKKQKIAEIKNKSTRLANELQELQIHNKQAQESIQKQQLKQIYNKKVQIQEQQTVKQILMLIEAKRNNLAKEKKLLEILNQELQQKQQIVKRLKDQAYDIQVGIARILPSLQSLTNDASKLQAQKTKLSQKVSTLAAKKAQIIAKTSQSNILIQQNTKYIMEITKTIEKLIQQSNQINQKTIKTRQHVLHVNNIKNHQKKLNQQLKLKVRELMRIVIESQSV